MQFKEIIFGVRIVSFTYKTTNSFDRSKIGCQNYIFYLSRDRAHCVSLTDTVSMNLHAKRIFCSKPLLLRPRTSLEQSYWVNEFGVEFFELFNLT